MGLGLVALIEMNYYMSTTYDASIPMELFGQKVSVHETIPWALAIAATIIGGYLFRLAIRGIVRAWDAVVAEIKQGGA
jgi:branched-chain amino acid transport system permease protein